MSTLKCQNCPQGLIMPDCDISNEDSSEKYYNCNTCDTKLKCKYLTNKFSSIISPSIFLDSHVAKKELELSELIENCYYNDAEKLHQILDDHQDKYHAQHYLILILKWLLINIYGRQKGYHYPLLEPKLIQDKIEFCTDYLKAMDIIDPGLSHNRGRSLWELYSVLAFQLSQEWKDQKISKSQFKTRIQSLIPTLEETIRCLTYYDSEGTLEYQVCKMATKALVNTRETLSFIDLI